MKMGESGIREKEGKGLTGKEHTVRVIITMYEVAKKSETYFERKKASCQMKKVTEFFCDSGTSKIRLTTRSL